jgi:hypothetical protein
MEAALLEGHHGGGIMEEASTLGFPPSPSKENRKLNIEYYQFVVHGTHEIFPKCLQRR